MSANPQENLSYTLEEYYALLKGSERRFEYWDGEIVLMSGVSRRHAVIQTNLTVLFVNQLKGKCETLGSDLAVKEEMNKAGFVHIYDKMTDIIEIQSISVKLALKEKYDNVEFNPK